MNATCIFCGLPEGGDLWVTDSNGVSWHALCGFQHARDPLASRPIKEHHDGPTTRDPGRRKPIS